MKYGALDTSEELRDAFERALQHPGAPFHPCTQVDKWTGGPPTFSRSGLTMSDFCPRSLGLPPIVYNYPQYTTAFLHHQQSTAMGANVSQMVIYHRKTKKLRVHQHHNNAMNRLLPTDPIYSRNGNLGR
jgi:hypothetical protein